MSDGNVAVSKKSQNLIFWLVKVLEAFDLTVKSAVKESQKVPAINGALQSLNTEMATMNELKGNILSSDEISSIASHEKPVEGLKALLRSFSKSSWLVAEAELPLLWLKDPDVNWNDVERTWEFASMSLKSRLQLMMVITPDFRKPAWKDMEVKLKAPAAGSKEVMAARAQTWDDSSEWMREKLAEMKTIIVELRKDEVEMKKANAKAATPKQSVYVLEEPSVLAVASSSSTTNVPAAPCQGCKTRHAYPHCCKGCATRHMPPYCRSKRSFGKYSIIILPISKNSPSIDIRVNGRVVSALLDSGANVSCVSSAMVNTLGLKIDKSGARKVRQAQGEITIHGTVEIDVGVGNLSRPWKFVVFDDPPLDVILGADVLFDENAVWNTLKRTFNWRGGKAVSFSVEKDEGEKMSVAVANPNSWNVSHLQSSRARDLLEVLGDFKSVFAEKLVKCGEADCQPIQVKLKPDAPEFAFIPERNIERLSSVEQEALDNFVKDGLQSGLIEEVDPSTPFKYNFNHVLAEKKNGGGIRVCANMININDILQLEPQVIPRISHLLKMAKGKAFISTLDITSAYNQISLHDDAKQFFSFSVRGRRLRYRCLPFGYHNAVTRYQAFMDRVLHGIPDVAVYVDDIAILSNTWEEHLATIKKVLVRLRKAGLKVKGSKCEFGKSEASFLGFIIDAKGVRADPAKMDGLLKAPCPTDVKGVRSFLAMAARYQDYIAEFYKKTQLMSTMLKADAR